MQGIPFNQLNETMTTAASGDSTAVKINPSGMLSCLITCPDTTSADGEFYWAIGDTETGTFETLSVPVVSKVAGAALATEPLQLDKPGTRWALVRYVRTSGGAAAEATLAVTVS